MDRSLRHPRTSTSWYADEDLLSDTSSSTQLEYTHPIYPTPAGSQQQHDFRHDHATQDTQGFVQREHDQQISYDRSQPHVRRASNSRPRSNPTAHGRLVNFSPESPVPYDYPGRTPPLAAVERDINNAYNSHRNTLQQRVGELVNRINTVPEDSRPEHSYPTASMEANTSSTSYEQLSPARSRNGQCWSHGHSASMQRWQADAGNRNADPTVYYMDENAVYHQISYTSGGPTRDREVQEGEEAVELEYHQDSPRQRQYARQHGFR